MGNTAAGALEQVDIDLATQRYGGFIGLKSGIYSEENGTPMPIKYELFPSILAMDEVKRHQAIVQQLATTGTVTIKWVSSAAGGPFSTGWVYKVVGRIGETLVHAGQFAIQYHMNKADVIANLERQFSEGNGVGAL